MELTGTDHHVCTMNMHYQTNVCSRSQKNHLEEALAIASLRTEHATCKGGVSSCMQSRFHLPKWRGATKREQCKPAGARMNFKVMEKLVNTPHHLSAQSHWRGCWGRSLCRACKSEFCKAGSANYLSHSPCEFGSMQYASTVPVSLTVLKPSFSSPVSSIRHAWKLTRHANWAK
eukprot:79561-Pelagomonas_calceolata.AAC.2